MAGGVCGERGGEEEFQLILDRRNMNNMIGFFLTEMTLRLAALEEAAFDGMTGFQRNGRNLLCR